MTNQPTNKKEQDKEIKITILKLETQNNIEIAKYNNSEEFEIDGLATDLAGDDVSVCIDKNEAKHIAYGLLALLGDDAAIYNEAINE